MLISFSTSRVAESERPENSPIFYLAVAGASAFPHSKQDDLDRDVINPQNGHILCDA